MEIGDDKMTILFFLHMFAQLFKTLLMLRVVLLGITVIIRERQLLSSNLLI